MLVRCINSSLVSWACCTSFFSVDDCSRTFIASTEQDLFEFKCRGKFIFRSYRHILYILFTHCSPIMFIISNSAALIVGFINTIKFLCTSVLRKQKWHYLLYIILPMYRLSHFFAGFLDHLKMKLQASTEMPYKREKCNDDTLRHVNCKNYWLECK